MSKKNKPLNTVSEVKKFLSTANPNQKRSVGNNLFIVKNKNHGVWKLEASKVDIKGKKTRPTITLGRFSSAPSSIDIQSLKPNKLNLLTLNQAREFAYNVKLKLAYNIDPNDKNNDEKTFIDVKNDWVEDTKKKWTEKHLREIERILGRYVYTAIGNIPIKSLTKKHFADILRPIYNDDKFETLKKVRGWCNNICDKAVSDDIIETNPFIKLKNDFQHDKSDNSFHFIKHMDDLPELYFAILNSKAEPSTKACLIFIMHTFQRTKETISAQWNEIDFNKKLWSIPNERMKKSFKKFAEGQDHLVPLSNQVINLLKKHYQITGDEEGYIFGGYRSRYSKPISSGTMLGLLKKVGYNGKMTVHGFRHFASTQLHDKYPEKTLVIEKQLSHKDTQQMRDRYNNAEYIELRIELMKIWTDMIESTISESS